MGPCSGGLPGRAEWSPPPLSSRPYKTAWGGSVPEWTRYHRHMEEAWGDPDTHEGFPQQTLEDGWDFRG